MYGMSSLPEETRPDEIYMYVCVCGVGWVCVLVRVYVCACVGACVWLHVCVSMCRCV